MLDCKLVDEGRPYHYLKNIGPPRTPGTEYPLDSRPLGQIDEADQNEGQLAPSGSSGLP